MAEANAASDWVNVDRNEDNVAGAPMTPREGVRVSVHNPTRIFILDRSGSMAVRLLDTIGGFNTYIEKQKRFGGTMTLIQFDHEYEVVYCDMPIDDVPLLSTETFVPRGSTALLDAIGKTIMSYDERPLPVHCIILTDGMENSSSTYTKAHVQDLIDAHQKLGWLFVFLGANQEAFSDGESLGIAKAAMLNFDSTNAIAAFRAVNEAMDSAEIDGFFAFD